MKEYLKGVRMVFKGETLTLGVTYYVGLKEL